MNTVYMYLTIILKSVALMKIIDENNWCFAVKWIFSKKKTFCGNLTPVFSIFLLEKNDVRPLKWLLVWLKADWFELVGLIVHMDYNARQNEEKEN